MFFKNALPVLKPIYANITGLKVLPRRRNPRPVNVNFI